MIKALFIAGLVITLVFAVFGLNQPTSVGHYPNYLRLLLLGIASVTGMVSVALGFLVWLK